ncbi:MAG: nitrile hydratase subunit alpha [Kiloniellaceae bacterium]
MAHDHSHGHPHDHGHGHQPHPFQPDLEETPLTHYQVMTQAVGDLLIDKGVFSAEELRAMLEAIDAKSPAAGARMVARAWVDDGFKARMLADVNAAAGELGIDAGGIPIRAVENTEGVHNVIVCTLCSCYPRLLIGLPPDWYKSRSYRSRTVREPRAVLAEFGTVLPEDVEVRVHDSTADLRYMVLPARPDGTEGWDEAALAGLVTRDCMIGVTLPKSPAA